ncbi:Uncharacterised protein [uncultured archaeon]|nr:Uncharacterised protein [uncultured archaeon]
MHFNPERQYECATVLKQVLSEKMESADIVKMVRAIKDQRKRNPPDTRNLKHAFRYLDEGFVLTNSIEIGDATEYCVDRYLNYDEQFKGCYGFSITTFFDVMNKIFNIAYERMRNEAEKGSILNTAIYSDGEAPDLGVIKKPPKEYIEAWKRVYILNKSELSEDRLKTNFFVENYSFRSTEQINEDFRFQNNPILDLDEDTIVIAFPYLLIRALPSRLGDMLSASKEYNDLKGKDFEPLVFELLRKIKTGKLQVNKRYGPDGNYEVDGILEFDESIWFVECKSRPPSEGTHKGKMRYIRRDLERTVLDAEEQAKRANDYIQEFGLMNYEKKKIGALIILDGLYPQLNENVWNEKIEWKYDIPKVVMNYFELKDLFRQENFDEMGKYLNWRTKKNPIVCLDEKDYWVWFTYLQKYPENQVLVDQALASGSIIITGSQFEQKDLPERLEILEKAKNQKVVIAIGAFSGKKTLSALRDKQR